MEADSKTSPAWLGPYATETVCYPIDLLGTDAFTNNVYGNNCIVFHINVHESSKFLDAKNSGGIIGDYTDTDTSRIAGQNLSGKQFGLGSAAEIAVPIALSGNGKDALKAGGAAIAGVGAVYTQTGKNFTRALKRIKSTIIMHAPNTYMARYGTQYSDESTDLVQMVAAAGEGVQNAVEKAWQMKSVDDFAKNSGQTASVIASLALKFVPGKAGISAATGLATNPKKEQIFQGVDFRTFNFEYQFFPRSNDEYESIKKIIKLFKFHMHPEYLDARNFMFVYPSEFDIEHLNNGKTNENLPKHKSCVLTEMTVNYAPQQMFTSFHGGIPTQISINLSFKELSIMTKQTIDEGY